MCALWYCVKLLNRLVSSSWKLVSKPLETLFEVFAGCSCTGLQSPYLLSPGSRSVERATSRHGPSANRSPFHGGVSVWQKLNALEGYVKNLVVLSRDTRQTDDLCGSRFPEYNKVFDTIVIPYLRLS